MSQACFIYERVSAGITDAEGFIHLSANLKEQFVKYSQLQEAVRVSPLEAQCGTTRGIRARLAG